MQKIVPVAVWSLLAMLVFIFAAVGIASGTHELNDSLVGGICQIDNTYLRFTHFLKEVKVPMKQLDEDFKVAVKELGDASKKNETLKIDHSSRVGVESGVSGRTRLPPRTLAHAIVHVVLHNALPTGHETSHNG